MIVVHVTPVDRLTTPDGELLLYERRLVRLGPLGAAVADLASGPVDLASLAAGLERLFGAPAGADLLDATRTAVEELVADGVLRVVAP